MAIQYLTLNINPPEDKPMILTKANGVWLTIESLVSKYGSIEEGIQRLSEEKFTKWSYINE